MDSALAMRLYLRGMKDKEIAEACEVTRETVARWRKQHGLPPAEKRLVSENMAELSDLAAEAKEHHTTYGKWIVEKEKRGTKK